LERFQLAKDKASINAFLYVIYAVHLRDAPSMIQVMPDSVAKLVILFEIAKSLGGKVMKKWIKKKTTQTT